MLKLSTPNIIGAVRHEVDRVLRSGDLTQGRETEAFEAELASFLGVGEVVTVSSGTAALHVACVAAGLGSGDAVLVPDFTFPATANAVAWSGARPVPLDVDPSTYTMRVELVERIILEWSGDDDVRAILPVHEFGCPAEMTALSALAERWGLVIIEDAACALGASWRGRRLGGLGAAGCFSFHPRKTLTTGEGGAIATDDRKLAARARRLRDHGRERDGGTVRFVTCGLNYRLTGFQAAMGRAQLPHLDHWIERRRELRLLYDEALAPLVDRYGLRLPGEREGHSWQTYMVILPAGVDRGAVRAILAGHGIETGAGAQCVSKEPSFADVSPCTAGVHVAAELAEQGLALPFCEQYAEAEVARVAAALAEALQIGVS